jgi:hypothetical protein
MGPVRPCGSPDRELLPGASTNLPQPCAVQFPFALPPLKFPISYAKNIFLLLFSNIRDSLVGIVGAVRTVRFRIQVRTRNFSLI